MNSGALEARCSARLAVHCSRCLTAKRAAGSAERSFWVKEVCRFFTRVSTSVSSLLR